MQIQRNQHISHYFDVCLHSSHHADICRPSSMIAQISRSTAVDQMGVHPFLSSYQLCPIKKKK